MKTLLKLLIMFVLIGCTPKPQSLAFTLKTYPKVDGSTVTIPLSEALAAQLTGLTLEEVRPIIHHSKTHEAYLNLIDRKVDLIFVTYPSFDELKYAQDFQVELEIVPIVSEAFIFMTHKDNPINSLTLSEIQDIYQGQITNWKDVGGDDVEIIAYQRPENSGSQTGFYDLVMKGLDVMEPPIEWVQGSMGDIIDAVATYQNKPDAIGYSYYYFVSDMWKNDQVKLLQVNGVTPNNETIASGEYPIKTYYYAVFRKDEKKNSDVRRIIDWLLSDSGQQLAENFGYVKVK